MRRHLALGHGARPLGKGITSLACLAFVLLLALAFWSGALWIGQMLLRLNSGG